jgi:drug/metabolite transporter (DMT)-like permease
MMNEGVNRRMRGIGSVGARAATAVVAANLMWGASIVAGKAALDGLPPLTLALARCAVALLVLLPLARRSTGPAASRRDSALLGITGVALFFVFYNLGILFTSATNATLILDGGSPIAAVLVAALVLGERPGRSGLLGTLCAFLGIVVVIVAGHDPGSVSGGSLLGDGLMLASVFSWAAYLTIGRRIFGGGADPVAVVARATAWGALFLAPAAAVEVALVGVGSFGIADVLLLLYLGIGCTALTDILLGFGLRHLEASRSAVLGNVAPLSGLACAVLFLGEPVTPLRATGAVLTLVGIWYATTGRDGAARSSEPQGGTVAVSASAGASGR